MRYLFFIVFLILVSCAETEESLTAQEIVDKAIENAGGKNYEQAEIEFTFRDRDYLSKRDGGKFSFERIRMDSTGQRIRDILNNEGLKRFVNDSATILPDSLVIPISNSVNSVHYFVQLPYGLNAEAANKELLGKDSISGKEYYEIKVTFDEFGGGTDHEDEYLYWIDTQNFEVDYLAYNFEVNDGGIRFRKAINPRRVGGIRIVDYENYKYKDLSTPLAKLDSLYQEGELEPVSLILTENVKVKVDPN